MNEANISREVVLADIIRLVTSVTADWDFDGEVQESTRLFNDLNWQSVDMVVLAHEIQRHFGRTIPFTDFLADVGTRGPSGVSVGELTDFVVAQLALPGTLNRG